MRDTATVTVITPYSKDRFVGVTARRSDLPGYLTIERDGVPMAWFNGDWKVEFA